MNWAIFQTLRQRKLLQWMAGYVAAAWAALQGLGMLSSTYGWSPAFMRIAVGVALVGFALALVLAWFHGESGAQRATRIEVLLLASLLFAGGFAIWLGEHNARDTVGVTTAHGVPGAQSPVAKPDDHTLAVLPFKNLSNSAETDGFVDGVHDDLLTQLAKVRALKVTSRTSVMEYRASSKRLPEIAAELHVANILEGGVQRAGNRIRINVQLIDARNDEHLWAETYDKELSAENIFAIQGELAASIAQALKAALTPAEQASTSRVLTTDLEALDLYRRAIALDWEEGEVSERKLEWLNQALARDPKFAAALALRAKTYMGQFWNRRPDPAVRDAARRDIDAGRAISPDLPELDIAEGYYYYWGFRDYGRASQLVERALAAIPGEARLHALRGFIARRAGDPALALTELNRALELDPGNDGVAADLGYTYFLTGQVTQARRVIDQARARRPDSAALAYRQALLEAMAEGDLAAGTRTLASRPLTFDFAAYYFRWWLANAQGDWTQSLAAADFGTARETAQGFYPPELMRGLSLRYAGKPGEAKAELERAISIVEARHAASPGDRRMLQARCLALGAAGRRDAALAACREARAVEIHDAMDQVYCDIDVAAGLALAGANDEALQVIEARSKAAYFYPPSAYELDPAFRGIVADARFRQLMAQLRKRGDRP